RTCPRRREPRLARPRFPAGGARGRARGRRPPGGTVSAPSPWEAPRTPPRPGRFPWGLVATALAAWAAVSGTAALLGASRLAVAALGGAPDPAGIAWNAASSLAVTGARAAWLVS